VDDVSELERFLEASLGRKATLRRLASVPEKSVFRMEGGDRPVFVKCAQMDDCRRTHLFLSAADLPFLPKSRFLLEWRGKGVLGLDWMEGRIVRPEDMNAAQAASLAAAYFRMLGELRAKAPYAMLLPPLDAEGLYASVADFAARHPVMAGLLRDLLDIPAAERTYDPATLSPIVGDFHCDNYAFDGDSVSAMYDFDWMRPGSPAEDLSYAVVRRLRKPWMPRSFRRRVQERFLQIVAASPLPPLEWRRAVNVCRLFIAAKRIRKHPGLGLVALDVRRRDAPLAELVALVHDRD
jgi:hypothetical protein